MLKFRSVKSMVIPPAKTGSDSRRRTAVIFTDQTNNGIRSRGIPSHRILSAVVIKFTAPKIEEMPARWSEKMAKSTAGPAWARL